MIIVTGGTGFIGSNLIATLNERGYKDITICDTLGRKDKWNNIAKHEIRDIVRPDELIDYMKKRAEQVNALFHLGGVISDFEDDADLIAETNYRFSRKLWKFCAHYDVRFIYTSSGATYGNDKTGFKDDESIQALSHLRPLSAQAWSKHAFDRRIARLTKDPDMIHTERAPKQYVGLKIFNAYGPNEYHKGDEVSIISRFCHTALMNHPASIFKTHSLDCVDGEQRRDFIYVKDCVDIMVWFMENPQISGLFNCGTGQSSSFKEVAALIYNKLNKELKIDYIDMPKDSRNKYQYYTQASMDKLRAAGYTKPFMTLEQGLNDYLDNYLTTKDIYR